MYIALIFGHDFIQQYILNNIKEVKYSLQLRLCRRMSLRTLQMAQKILSVRNKLSRRESVRKSNPVYPPKLVLCIREDITASAK